MSFDCNKINIIYRPSLLEEDRIIFEDCFGKNNLCFNKKIVKGLSAGVFDVEYIINIINHPVTKLIVTAIISLIRKLFRNKRERHLIVIIRKEESHITISNCNKEKQIKVSYVKKAVEIFSDKDYSDEVIKKLIC